MLYIIKVVLHYKIIYILLIIENTRGMPHMKNWHIGFKTVPVMQHDINFAKLRSQFR